jgi:Zn-finger nucleic acid-binding protein
MRLGSKIPQQQQEIVDEALEETSFQFASAEVFLCPNRCGRGTPAGPIELTYDRHDKVSQEAKLAARVIGLVCLVFSMIILVQGIESRPLVGGPTSSAEFAFAILLVAALALGYSLFATGETTAYFYCMKCRGAMLDSKTIISKIGEEKALAIERELSRCKAGEKMCPSCEGRMNRIPITYVMPDNSSGNIGFDLIRAMIPNKKEYLDLDGCPSCGLFWFDSGEMSNVSLSESMKVKEKRRSK